MSQVISFNWLLFAQSICLLKFVLNSIILRVKILLSISLPPMMIFLTSLPGNLHEIMDCCCIWSVYCCLFLTLTLQHWIPCLKLWVKIIERSNQMPFFTCSTYIMEGIIVPVTYYIYYFVGTVSSFSLSVSIFSSFCFYTNQCTEWWLFLLLFYSLFSFLQW